MLTLIALAILQRAPDTEAPRKLDELEQKMLRLAERTASTEPENAERLRKGVKLLRERGTGGRAQAAIDEWLKGNPENSARHRDSVVTSLQRLLDILEGKERKEPDKHMTIEELYVALEEELVRLIALQTALNAEARAEEGKPVTRPLAIRFAAFAVRERAMRETVDQFRRVLAEKNCAVFAFALGLIGDDMGDLADRLDAARVDPPMKELQERVLRRLRDLLDALREARKNLKNRPSSDTPPDGGEKPPGPPDDPRRVPDAAELELIRKIQEDIYRRTKAADITDLGDAQTTVLRRLSDEQGKLAELLKGLIERMK